MSLSNILLSNNPVSPQPWTNLTCNSLAVATIPLFPNAGAYFQAVPGNLPFSSNASGGFAPAINFNLTVPAVPTSGQTYNFYPSGIIDDNQASGGGLKIVEAGVYKIKFVLIPFRVDVIGAAGNLRILLKVSQNGASGPFVDIGTSIVYAVTEATDALGTVDAIVYLNANTTIQIVVERTGGSTSAGNLVIPAPPVSPALIGSSYCNLVIQRLG